MPARGSGLTRLGAAIAGGAPWPRTVPPEVRQRISDSLHRFYGTEPGTHAKHKPRPKVGSAHAGAARVRPVGRHSAVAQGARAKTVRRTAVHLVWDDQHPNHRKAARTAHLISAHTRRGRRGLVHVHRRRHNTHFRIVVHRRARAHRVWKRGRR